LVEAAIGRRFQGVVPSMFQRFTPPGASSAFLGANPLLTGAAEGGALATDSLGAAEAMPNGVYGFSLPHLQPESAHNASGQKRAPPGINGLRTGADAWR
jgi:hypothetical protein